MVRDCSTCGGSRKSVDSFVCEHVFQDDVARCRTNHFSLWHQTPEFIPDVIELCGPEAIDEAGAVGDSSANIFMLDLQETAHEPFMRDCVGYTLATIFPDGVRLEVNSDVITGGFFISGDAIEIITAGISGVITGLPVDFAEIFSMFETKKRPEPQAPQAAQAAQEDLYGPRVEPEVEPTDTIQGCPGGPLVMDSEDDPQETLPVLGFLDFY